MFEEKSKGILFFLYYTYVFKKLFYIFFNSYLTFKNSLQILKGYQKKTKFLIDQTT